MATPTAAQGTKLYRETTPASGTFTLIASVTDLTHPPTTTAMADTTAIDATSATTTQIPTLTTTGDCSFNILWDSADAAHLQLRADAAAQTSRLYKIVTSDTGADDERFNAWVTSFAVSSDRAGVNTAAVTLSPTGVLTLA